METVILQETIGNGTPPDGYKIPKRIDGTSGTSYQLVAAPGGSIQPKQIILKTVEVDNVSGDCLISVGTNASDYDNILKTYRIRPVIGAVETLSFDFRTKDFQDVTGPLYSGTEVKLNVYSPASSGTLKFTVSFSYDSLESF